MVTPTSHDVDPFLQQSQNPYDQSLMRQGMRQRVMSADRVYPEQKFRNHYDTNNFGMHRYITHYKLF